MGKEIYQIDICATGQKIDIEQKMCEWEILCDILQFVQV